MTGCLTPLRGGWSEEYLLILRRDVLPGGRVGRFQGDVNVILAGEEQRHLWNRVPHGKMGDERFDNGPTNVGRGGQWALASQDVFLRPNLVQNDFVDTVGVARAGRMNVDQQKVNPAIESGNRLVQE